MGDAGQRADVQPLHQGQVVAETLQQRLVQVRVRIDQTRKDQHALGVDRAPGLEASFDLVTTANGHDGFALDDHATVVDHQPVWPRGDDGAAEDQQVDGRHRRSPARCGPSNAAISSSTPASLSTVAST